MGLIFKQVGLIETLNQDLSLMSDKITTRSTWEPKSFDEENNSVRVVAVTENPVRVWSTSRSDFVDEILLVEGFNLPPSGKIPLLDSHNRGSVNSVLGSARRFAPVDGKLECDVFFSGTDVGRNAALNVKEGHLTDFSVGYLPLESCYVEEGETKDINGRIFEGPVLVTSRWNLKELSLTPVGADQNATARSETMENPVSSPFETMEDSVPPTEEGDLLEMMEPEPPEIIEKEEPTPPEQVREDAGEMDIQESQPEKTGSEKTVIDFIFYAFLALMVLSMLQGLF